MIQWSNNDDEGPETKYTLENKMEETYYIIPEEQTYSSASRCNLHVFDSSIIRVLLVCKLKKGPAKAHLFSFYITI